MPPPCPHPPASCPMTRAPNLNQHSSLQSRSLSPHWPAGPWPPPAPPLRQAPLSLSRPVIPDFPLSCFSPVLSLLGPSLLPPQVWLPVTTVMIRNNSSFDSPKGYYGPRSVPNPLHRLSHRIPSTTCAVLFYSSSSQML